MDLTYSDEQRALRDSAERYLRERYTVEQRRAPGSAWPAFAAQGWLGLLVSADDGGIGGSLVDVGLLCEQMGRNLVCEPYVSTAVLCQSLIAHLANPQERQHLLEPLVEGRARYAFAHQEPGLDPFAASVSTRASGDAAAPRLEGRKAVVCDIDADGELIVSAMADGGQLRLYRVALGAEGVRIDAFPTVDGRQAATVTFAGAAATPMSLVDGADATIACALDRATAALASDMVGAMQAALDATVAYSKMRVQFGQPIGANQVIKHRLVEMAIKCEEARSMALLAAIRCSDGSPAVARARAVSGAKIKIAKAARAVCEDAVQIHGGMGVTDELDIGSYLKRAIAFEAVFGTIRQHRQRYARSATVTGAAA